MRVFVSSVYHGLVGVRDRLIRLINVAGDKPVSMEGFGARPEQPLGVCLSELRSSDVVILIIGPQYGSVDQGSGLSFTHLEFREAMNHSIPVLAFEVPPERAGDMAEEEESLKKLAAFRQEVRATLTAPPLDDPNTVPGLAMASLKKFATEWSAGIGQYRTFQDANDFFGPLLDPKALFNHTHGLVGRDAVIAELEGFLEGEATAAVLAGAGGVGKSKILLELAKRRRDRPPRLVFLGPQFDLSSDHLRGLPRGSVCVVVDDAHRLTAPDELVRTMAGLNEGPKLLLTCRPAGLDRLRYALRILPEEHVLHLDELWPLDAEVGALELAKRSVGEARVYLAQGLVDVSDGNPLVITVGGKLIQEGRIEPELLAHKERFKTAALDGLLADLPATIAGDVPARRLLEALSAVGPVRPGREPIEDLLASYLAVSKSSVIRALTDLREEHRLILRRGYKVRVQPDVLADHLLFGAAVADGASTGFVDEIFSSFGSVYLSNILTNVGELEWRCRTAKTPVDVLADVWAVIKEAMPALSHRGRRDLIGRLEGAAWFAPQQTWDIIQWLCQNEDAPEDPEPIIRTLGIGQEAVLGEVPRLLKTLAWHADFTARCATLLWRLGAEDDRTLHAHPEAPLRVLQDILSYDPQKPPRLQMSALEGLRAAAGEEGRQGVFGDVSEVVSVLLARDPTFNRSDGRSLRLSSFALPPSNPAVTALRHKACEVLEQQATGGKPKLAVQAIDKLRKLLSSPHGHFGREVSDEELLSWQPEVRDGIDMLAGIANATSFPAVAFEVTVLLREHQDRFAWPALGDHLDAVLAKLNHLHKEFVIYKAIIPNRRVAFRRSDWQAAENDHIEQVHAIAEGMWRDAAEPREIIENVGQRIAELADAGIDCDVRFLIQHLGELREDAIPALARAVLESPYAQLKRRSAPTLFGQWLKHDSAGALAAIRSAVEADEDEDLVAGIASGYASKWFGKPEDYWKEHLKNIELLLGSHFTPARHLAAHSLWWAKGICEREAMDVLVSIDCGGDAKLLDEALLAVDSTHGISPTVLTGDDVRKLLKQVEQLPQLEHRSYHIDGFLGIASRMCPVDLVRMLLARIGYAASLPDGHAGDSQPLPHVDFHKGVGALAETAEYQDLLREIRQEVLKDHWVYRHWVPRLYSLAAAGFCQPAMDVLREWALSDQPDHVAGAAHLTREAEHAFVFTNHEFVASTVRNAERLGEDCVRRVRSAFFSVAISGVVSSGVGKAPPRYVQDKQSAQRLAHQYREELAVARFYGDLADYFERQIRESMAMDEELLDE